MGTQIYKLINGIVHLDEYLKDKEELDADLVNELRNSYSVDAEFALTNKGIEDKKDPEYLAYRGIVNSLKSKRDATLAENEAKLQNTEEITITENDEQRTIIVYKE